MNTEVAGPLSPIKTIILALLLAGGVATTSCKTAPADKKSDAVKEDAVEAPEATGEAQPEEDSEPQELSQARRFEFSYEATIAPAGNTPVANTPGGNKHPVDIFLPIAQTNPQQEILSVEVDSPVEGEFRTEQTYGNRFWHARLDELPAEPLTIRVTYELERKPFVQSDLQERAGEDYTAQELEEHSLFLKSNRLVPVDGEVIDEVIADIGFTEDDSLVRQARKIYDHVVDTMEYKKIGTGWGNGDTYWACSERYGNCTDFHALFTSLARHQGIPARFEIGFPVPTDRREGEIGGYHCWVQFYLPEVGWTPIDASEAKKHPEMRDELFGAHPVDRIQFTVGRDLQLGSGHTTGPLNYFVYPHVEVVGEQYDGVETKFGFAESKG